MARVSNEMMAKRAAPVRDALRKIVKERLKTVEDHKKLAEFMGTSLHYVHSMLYRGEGGLDAWINALMFCFDLDSKTFLERLGKRLPQKSVASLTPADSLWYDLDKLLKPKQKLWWARILRAAVLEGEKRPSRKEGRK